MHYHPLTAQDREHMLEVIGVSSFDELITSIPSSLRGSRLKIPNGISEQQLQRELARRAKQNVSVKEALSFLGGGSYEHFIPSAVSSVLSRHEFYTAYTPYQPEASQGSLQSIFEFQSMIAELMGLDVSNASHYDGSTSLAEAALLALRHTGRNKILISRATHPHYRQVLRTYLEGTPYTLEEIGFDHSGRFLEKELEKALDSQIAGVILQQPNFFGTLEELQGLSDRVHAAGALFILSSNPITLGVLKSPGEWGADIAVGEGQPLGLSLHFGGPYLGLFAVRQALVRKVPGRLAGLTVDSEGKRAYCLTLQAREQHIRREKAASNICTNQALCALAACVYLTLMGREGLHQIGALNIDRTAYLRQQLTRLKRFSILEDQPVFNEFLLKSEMDTDILVREFAKKKIFPGISLNSYYPEFKNHLLINVTETKTKEDIDLLVRELAAC